jgi:hypothetical protein
MTAYFVRAPRGLKCVLASDLKNYVVKATLFHFELK